MRPLECRLQLVRPEPPRPAPEPEEGRGGDRGDLWLAAALFAVFFLPIVSALARFGQWRPAELGLAAAGSIFAGRALVDSLLELLRDRRRS